MLVPAAIGKREAPLLARLVRGGRVLDLLLHLPSGVIDRRATPTLAEAVPGTIATLALRVRARVAPRTPRQPWRVIAADGTGTLELTLFRPRRLPQLPPGAAVVVSGKLSDWNGRLRMTHPDHVEPAAGRDRIPRLEPCWPLVAGIGQATVRRAMAAALARLPAAMPEWIDGALRTREDWPAFPDAIRALQAPAEDASPGRADAARVRLAYDELLAHQLAVLLVRRRARLAGGRALRGDGTLRAEALRRFGHAPTPSQTKALVAIDADLAAPRRMLRLLQGDVGAGKTLVALLAMLRAAEDGTQAALMAPTEVLARQHFRTLERLSPLPPVLLTGSVRGKARRQALARIASGEARLVVGTHALFSEDVRYRDLGLAVIDEQHRFGVAQRLMLGAKGDAVDLLVMTATPIPRTMLLARWGEMDVSRIEGKPAGRKPIRTTIHSQQTQLGEVVEAVGRQIEAGGRVFWVCPLIDESEESDLAAASARFAELRARFGAVVGLAHGRQEEEVREAALAAFAAGETRLLVATTVIEVGVDVPDATVMVVEHAERFGLAQLHQLRGRVGRGAAQSFCLLLHDGAPGEIARSRLALLRETEDGFRIADADFATRGGGEALGTRQSGLPGFRLAVPEAQERLLAIARRDAETLLARDPRLAGPRGAAALLLLALFGYEDAHRLLEAG